MIKTKAKIRMNIASPVRNIDNVKKNNKQDRHKWQTCNTQKWKNKRIWFENVFSFFALVSTPGEKICAEAPNVKDHLPSPRCDPTLWRLWRGGRRRCKSVSARQKEPLGASSLDATCSQGVLLRVSNCLTRAPKKKKGGKKTQQEVCRGLFFGLWSEGVLNTEDDVGARAAAGGLLQEVAALQRWCQTCHSVIAHPPCFTVVVCLPVALVVWSMPDHFLWPGEGHKQSTEVTS